MVELIKQLFGGSVSAVEAFVGVVGINGVISLIVSIWIIAYKGKKFDKGIEQINKETNEKISEFKKENEVAINTFKEQTKKNIDNLCNMFLIEATKQGVDLEKFNAIVGLYKDTISTELLDTDKLVEEKTEEIAQEQSTQEEVNENINKINELNGLV